MKGFLLHKTGTIGPENARIGVYREPCPSCMWTETVGKAVANAMKTYSTPEYEEAKSSGAFSGFLGFEQYAHVSFDGHSYAVGIGLPFVLEHPTGDRYFDRVTKARVKPRAIRKDAKPVYSTSGIRVYPAEALGDQRIILYQDLPPMYMDLDRAIPTDNPDVLRTELLEDGEKEEADALIRQFLRENRFRVVEYQYSDGVGLIQHHLLNDVIPGLLAVKNLE